MSREVRQADSAPGLTGRPVPRLYSRPLVPPGPSECPCGTCGLDETNSNGFAMIEFARDVLGEPLHPFQEFLAIHLLEIRPSGLYRFRTVLVLIARQSGKSHFMKVLGLFRLYVEQVDLVLGVAQTLEISREAWQAGADQAKANQWLSPEIESIRRVNGDQELKLLGGRRWRIAAANRGAGRGLSVDALFLDEIREQRSWAAWAALSKTVSARPRGMILAISNAGDDESVVLNHLRETALSETDDTLGLFEWSAPEGCPIDDEDGWVQANPGLGFTVREASIRSSLTTDPPEVFRTEILCQRVKLLNPAIDQDQWHTCTDPAPFTEKRRVAFCLDVAPNQQHATLAAAAVLPDGRVRVEIVKAWDGINCLQQLKNELPGLVIKNKPKALGWFPVGPAAALASSLKTRKVNWPPAGVKVEAISGEAAAVCMGFASEVSSLQVAHSADPLLDAHVGSAERLQQGDSWRFTRKGQGNVDALYAAAGAVHLARSLPEPGSLRILTPKEANE